MKPTSEHYEFIIIGTGAGGGTIARQLAEAGRKILILERGDFLPQEQQNWSAKAVFQDSRYVSPDVWHDKDGKPFQPQSHYFVGGATKVYGAALFRLRPSDFEWGNSSEGESPAWPISYADMEPFYSRAEQLYQVHGNHGEDPTEGPWSKQYPYPAVSHSPRIQQVSDDLTAAGYHPFHAPSAVLLNEGGNPVPGLLPCVRCNTCDGHPCRVRGKADAEVIGIRPILDLPNITLVTNAKVSELIAYRGRVTHVMTLQGDRVVTYTGDTVILAAGAVNTAKILLSSNRVGIANSSGQVGRNYMSHNSMAVMALSEHPNPTVFQKTLALDDWYHELGSIQMVGKSCAEAMRGESPALTALLPDYLLRKVATHSVDFWLMTEDLPLPQNRVTLDAGGNVRLSRPELTGKAAMHGLYAKLKQVMRESGMTEVYAGKNMPLAAVAHQAGTARMGNDPATSVVDAMGKSHDTDNLYIVDTSVFPSIGAVNPALTAMANALRVGSHLLEG